MVLGKFVRLGLKALGLIALAALLAGIFLAYQYPGLLLDFVNFNYCG